MRFFEQSNARTDGARERAPHVTKQLGLDQFVGQRRAIDRAQPAITPRTEPMQRPGDQFLPGAALAFNQHGKRCGSGADDALAHGSHERTLPDDLRNVVPRAGVGGDGVETRPNGRSAQRGKDQGRLLKRMTVRRSAAHDHVAGRHAE
jgi:hypothetical protein